MTDGALTIEKRGALFYLIDEEGEVVGLGYTHRREAEEALDVLMRSSRPSTRSCMTCGRSFESAGSHNRMCPRCKGPSAR